MTKAVYLLLAVYSMAMSIIALYCLSQLYLLFEYIKKIRKIRNLQPPPSPQEWPEVTIQLPIFNEQYVAERLIRNIMSMDYPKDKLYVQILDDSTDETVQITRALADEYQAKAFNIQWLHREDRSGYKAGALREGMNHISTPFVAIFDADFLPRPDFLKKTVPYFQDEKTGVVQTRWEHINTLENLLTRLQAIQLNVHFTIEQTGRFASGNFLQFNGTAGVWRTETIHDAGGWEADTLTEDLDLSYRAQLKQWNIRYLEEVGAPAELPAEISGLKSQQHRWMKGGAENARKLLPGIWLSDESLSRKIQATSHLLSSSVFLAVLMLSIISVPLSIYLPQLDISTDFLQWFLLSFISIIFIYLTGNVFAPVSEQPFASKLISFLISFPLFLSVSMAMALHNSVAVWQGWSGLKSPFVRTPKSGQEKRNRNKYLYKHLNWIHIGEWILCCLFAATSVNGFLTGNNPLILLHIMLALGYGLLSYYSLKDAFSK